MLERTACVYFYIPGKYLYERDGSTYKKFLDLFVAILRFMTRKKETKIELSYSKWKKPKIWNFRFTVMEKGKCVETKTLKKRQ